MSLQRTFAIWTEFTRTWLAENGELTPMWQLSCADGIQRVVLTPWQSQRDKEAAVAFIQALLAAYDGHAWMFASEAWAADESPDPDVRQLLAGERSDRREVLVLHAGQRDGRRLGTTTEMIRCAAGKLTLGPAMSSKVATSWMFDRLFAWEDVHMAARVAARRILERSEGHRA